MANRITTRNHANPRLLKVLSPYLIGFCEKMKENGIRIGEAPPDIVAKHFRQSFHLVVPFQYANARALMRGLSYLDVRFRPGMERELGIRGYWHALRGEVEILLDSERPEPSWLKTLIHEICEQLIQISYVVNTGVRQLGKTEMERYANRFAASCKMPPDVFRHLADECAYDLEHLKQHFDDTLAGVSRHLRDLNHAGRFFYFCRCDLEYYPDKNCPGLLDVINATHGVPVRVVDAVRTEEVANERRAGGALPMFNLPAADHFRVAHPVFSEMTKSGCPFYLPSVSGGASDREWYEDLFCENDLSMLVCPYGRNRVTGFYLIAYRANEAHLISRWVARLQPEVRDGLRWVFSWASETRPSKHPEPTQPVLAHTDEQGKEFSLVVEEHLWQLNHGDATVPELDMATADEDDLYRSSGPEADVFEENDKGSR